MSRKFPLTNRLRLERAVSEALITAAEAEVEAAEQKLEAEVMGHALRWLALRDSRELKKKQMTGGETLAAEMNRVAARGEGSPVEAAQFELESQEISLDLLKLESGLTTLEGAVRPMLGLSSGESLTFTGSLAIPGTSAAPHHGLRADQRAARAKAEAARRTVELARAGKWEDVSLALGYTREHTDDAGAGLEKENFISLRFSFPLPLSRKQCGKNCWRLKPPPPVLRRNPRRWTPPYPPKRRPLWRR